jgi:AcrR family transcriptional regulator
MPKVSTEHRLARRDQIIAAARRCVGREGFHKTTMADVINEAGLSAGAVYGYFKSKNDIIRAIAELAVGEVAHRLEDLVADNGQLTPEDALRAVLYQILELAEQEDGDLTRIGVQAWSEALRDEAIHLIVSEKMRLLRDAFEQVVRRAQADGSIDAGADPAVVAQTLLGLVPGFVVQRLMLGDITPRSYVDGFRALTMR